jgi:hypothetical protein
MPSHLSDIGFKVDDDADFLRLVTQAAQKGEVIAAPDGSYVKWSPGAGIELWAQLDREDEIIGLNPYYSGEASMRIGLIRRIPDPEGTLLDGAFCGRTDPDEHQPETGAVPFVFDVPDFRSNDDLRLPTIVGVRMAAFAHELQGFEDEKAFDDSQLGEIKFAAQSFIPSGLFASEGSTEQAEAFFAGHIRATAIITNPATDADFLWARVETIGGEIEVVADPELLEGSLVVGGIMKGSFWLTGRLLGSDVEERELP